MLFLFIVAAAGIFVVAYGFGLFSPDPEDRAERERIAEMEGLLSGKYDPEKFWREEAKKRGFDDVGEFKKVREQELLDSFHQELITEHGLTQEEAETIQSLPWHFDSFDKEAKRRGISFIEVKVARWDKIMEEEPPEESCGARGFYECEHWADQFEREGGLPPDIVAHLNQCENCNDGFLITAMLSAAMAAPDTKKDENQEQEDDGNFKKQQETGNEIRKTLGLRPAREIRAEQKGVTVEELERQEREWFILAYGGEDCFTLKERLEYVRAGRLPAERFAHTTACSPCLRMIEADREDFLQTGKIGGLAAKALQEQHEQEKKGQKISEA